MLRVKLVKFRIDFLLKSKKVYQYVYEVSKFKLIEHKKHSHVPQHSVKCLN